MSHGAHLAADLLRARFCRERTIAPRDFDGETITVAAATTTAGLQHEIELLTDCCVVIETDSPGAIRTQIDELFGRPTAPGVLTTVEETWGRITEQIVDRRASAAFIEYTRDAQGHEGGRVRLKAQGDMQTVETFPLTVFENLTNFLLTRSLEGEQRNPQVGQRGKLAVHVDGSELNLRLSTFPIHHPAHTGLFKIALRILRRSEFLPSLDRLGILPEHRTALLEQIGAARCTLLVGAPPGEGKSTTFYALLKQLPLETLNVYTIEDPPEISFPLLTQTPVRSAQGWTTAEALVEILRQEPDFVFVGEILDRTVADLVMSANRRGVKIGSTVHADDVLAIPEAIYHLGVDPHAIAGLTGLASQRLVQILCAHCRVPSHPSDVLRTHLTRIGIDAHRLRVFERAPGCERCTRGIVRRTAVVETLALGPEMRTALQRHDPHTLARLARQAGYVTMLEEAVLMILRGEVSQHALSTFPDPDAHALPISAAATGYHRRLIAADRLAMRMERSA